MKLPRPSRQPPDSSGSFRHAAHAPPPPWPPPPIGYTHPKGRRAIAGKDRWIQDALDAWLSDEPGTGPEGDEGWRERTGYFQSVWSAGEGGAAAAPAAPAAPQPAAVPPAPRDPGRSWLAADYEEERTKLRTTMTAFINRLFYAFPDRNAMTIDDLAAAAGWIADMERQLRVAGGWAVLHKAGGRPELGREVDAALAELAQLRQAYALQRKRIEQREAQRIREINSDPGAFVRNQDIKRRDLVRETDIEIAEMGRKPAEQLERIRDRQHRDFVAYLRGENVYRIEIEREL